MFTPEHLELQATVRRLIDREITPYIDKWESDEIFPAHTVFKKLGSAGLLGVNKPVEFGGMGLEGQVKLGHRHELAAIRDPNERLATYERLVSERYERGKA